MSDNAVICHIHRLVPTRRSSWWMRHLVMAPWGQAGGGPPSGRTNGQIRDGQFPMYFMPGLAYHQGGKVMRHTILGRIKEVIGI